MSTGPDLIVAGPNPVIHVFKAATNSIPLVGFMFDPLESGLVTDLSRPSGNLTGITLDAGIGIWAKRLEILKEAVPWTTKAAFIGMRDGWEGSSGRYIREAAERLNISIISLLPRQGTSAEIEEVFAGLAQVKPDALLVSGEGDLYAHRQLIAELVRQTRIPAMCPYRDYVDAGGLLAYTVDLAELLKHLANQVHLIMTGAKPGDIPIYQPRKFDLMINLKTAKEMGVTLPPALLASVAEFVE